MRAYLRVALRTPGSLRRLWRCWPRGRACGGRSRRDELWFCRSGELATQVLQRVALAGCAGLRADGAVRSGPDEYTEGGERLLRASSLARERGARDGRLPSRTGPPAATSQREPAADSPPGSYLRRRVERACGRARRVAYEEFHTATSDVMRPEELISAYPAAADPGGQSTASRHARAQAISMSASRAFRIRRRVVSEARPRSAACPDGLRCAARKKRSAAEDRRRSAREAAESSRAKSSRLTTSSTARYAAHVARNLLAELLKGGATGDEKTLTCLCCWPHLDPADFRPAVCSAAGGVREPAAVGSLPYPATSSRSSCRRASRLSQRTPPQDCDRRRRAY